MADYHSAVAPKSNNSRLQRGPGTNQTSSSAMRKYKGALVGGGAMSLGLNSPSAGGARQNSPPRTSMAAPSSANYESMPVFTINKSRGIPGKQDIRNSNSLSNRMASLMSMPKHKSGTTKFDVKTNDRTIAPLTSEDLGHFNNLSLMSTLRSQNPSAMAGSNRAPQGTLVDNSPSFYDDDMRKKREKYNASIQDRALFKRVNHSNDRRTIF